MKTTTGEFLATLRKAGGYTQQEVADKLGVSNRTLSSWETDRTAPDLLILPVIADLYGVTVDEILRGERRASADKEAEISNEAKRSLRKRRFAKYGVRRALCLGFGLLGGALFFAGWAVYLYSGAPLWLSVLLMALGAVGCAACVILLACFYSSAVRGEGIVLKDDYTDDTKPFVLTLRHSVATALLWLSLPYILGAIIFLIVFFAAGFYNYKIIVGGVSVEIDYTTPTIVCVCLNVVFALVLFISGLVCGIAGVKTFGNAGQRAAFNSNGKLLGKICGFGAIPVAIALILYAVFCVVNPCTESRHFETDSVEGVYKEFQTFSTEGITEEYEDGTVKTLVPAGDYYLDFQTENYVVLIDDFDFPYRSTNFYDLGNGFYGRENYVYWDVYHVIEGKDIGEAEEGESCLDYLRQVGLSYYEIGFPSKDGEWLHVVNVKYSGLKRLYGDWEQRGLILWQSCRSVRYNEKAGVYRYETYCYYDYSLVFLVVLVSVAGTTLAAGTVAYFKKRRKLEYTF